MDTVVAPPPLSARGLSRPLERLESELVDLASQLTSATARFLALVADYDAAEGWREWGMRSTAHWLSWKCGVSVTTGREQVRVARALLRFPAIAAAFAAGRLSYSKVRALTRFAATETEAALVEMAQHATAAQVEQLRVANARARTAEDVRDRHAARGLTFRVDEDGAVTGSFHLPPEQAALFLHALRLQRDRLPRTVDAGAEDASAEAPDARERRSTADALVSMAQAALNVYDGAAGPGAGDKHQLVIHATVEQLAQPDDTIDDGEPILLDNGWRLHPATARRLTCGCPSSTATYGPDGQILHLGRKTRRIRGRLLRAVQVRDRGRCRVPGCTEASTAVHHLRHWANGGRTCLSNLISLCDAHHWLVHEGGFTLVPRSHDSWALLGPTGVTVDAQPRPLPVTEALPHDPDIAPDAVTGHWSGDHLELDSAITALQALLDVPAPGASAEAHPAVA